MVFKAWAWLAQFKELQKEFKILLGILYARKFRKGLAVQMRINCKMFLLSPQALRRKHSKGHVTLCCYALTINFISVYYRE
jgi:hypothetical protein